MKPGGKQLGCNTQGDVELLSALLNSRVALHTEPTSRIESGIGKAGETGCPEPETRNCAIRYHPGVARFFFLLLFFDKINVSTRTRKWATFRELNQPTD